VPLLSRQRARSRPTAASRPAAGDTACAPVSARTAPVK